MKPNLDRVTLVCVDCYNHGEAVTAIKKSMEQCDFAAVKFLTDIDIEVEGVQTVRISPIRSKEEYSHFLIKELHKYFDTKYVLVIQHDGYVLDGNSWLDEFYDYDYIGAPWLYSDGRNVGNGGFSLRSSYLQTILATDEFITITSPEDEIIGRLYRDYLIKEYAIKFPSDEVADKFSFELRTPIQNTFGFHGKFHQPFKPTVIIKRTAALGDVILVEPVLEYFHSKGYNVVLDTVPKFYLMFENHYFPVKHLSQVDKRLFQSREVAFINLDLAYESFPSENRLESYYRFCGIKDGKMRNPKLSLGFPINEQTKLFQKYCVIHLEERAQPERNVFGINWTVVAKLLQGYGYTVIQVGKGKFEQIKGATYMNTMNENFLCYTIAGADLFIGVDSGLSHIASGFNIPSIIFFGNTNPKIVHPDLSNKFPITNQETPICDKPYCWHLVVGGVAGSPCYINAEFPPCTQFKTEQVIKGIQWHLNQQK